jgi:hypothetical protein
MAPDGATVPVPTIAAAVISVEQCTTVTFDGFVHGDDVMSIDPFGVTLTLSAERYDSPGPDYPVAYDVELTGADLAGLNDTHDDTQAERDCTDCLGHGRTLVVPDEDFANEGDNTQGGEIVITGFAADTEGSWEIQAFDVVDGDESQGFTTLFVDAVQTAQSTRTGNATVEWVTVPENTITTDVRISIGSPTDDASSGIDNLVLCRTHEEEEGGEGCTPGYWRQPHHYDSWVGYAPTDSYFAVFGAGPVAPLGETIAANGGGEMAFLRHSTAALLNSTSGISYDMGSADVIQLVVDTYAAVAAETDPKLQKKIFEAAKDVFAGFNEQYCPLN